MPTIVDSVYGESLDLLRYLADHGEISRRNSVAERLAKHLVISAASDFEFRIMSAVAGLATAATDDNPAVVTLIRQKAIDRQYHTYFDWEAANANRFLSLFGGAFRARVQAKIGADENLAKGVKAFLEMGSLRNKLAHVNFATFPLDKTLDEVFHLYQSAVVFVDLLEVELAASA